MLMANLLFPVFFGADQSAGRGILLQPERLSNRMVAPRRRVSRNWQGKHRLGWPILGWHLASFRVNNQAAPAPERLVGAGGEGRGRPAEAPQIK
jgi:hypothetical protein